MRDGKSCTDTVTMMHETIYDAMCSYIASRESERVSLVPRCGEVNYGDLRRDDTFAKTSQVCISDFFKGSSSIITLSIHRTSIFISWQSI